MSDPRDCTTGHNKCCTLVVGSIAQRDVSVVRGKSQVLCGNADVVNVLCDDEPQALQQMLTTSRLLLHVAARNGHEAIVWRLCGSRANVNVARRSTSCAVHRFTAEVS